MPAVPVRALMNKRILGYLSWHVRRRQIHRRAILDLLATDLRAREPDHVVVTGDLTNISLPAEFELATEWLSTLGAPDRISVVPGNHDAYVAVPYGSSWARWAAYMATEQGADPVRASDGGPDFPFIRRRDSVAVIGLSTAFPSRAGSAAGRLGPRQLDALERWLERMVGEDIFRCVLLHHPPQDGLMSPRKHLIDAASFRAIIERAGAELVLHGHGHTLSIGEIKGPKGPVPVIGVPSASAVAGHHWPGSRYHVYDIGRRDESWTIRLRARSLTRESVAFADAESRLLEIAR